MNGKAKIDFEKWLKNKDPFLFDDELLGIFNLHPLLVQALIIEFFDSVAITVDTIPRISDNKVVFEPNTFCLKHEILTEDFEQFDTRQEATEKAIEKAVEIYNNLK